MRTAGNKLLTPLLIDFVKPVWIQHTFQQIFQDITKETLFQFFWARVEKQGRCLSIVLIKVIGTRTIKKI